MSEAIHLLMPLDTEVSEAMATAFESAWASLCSSGERLTSEVACEARIHLARTILDHVQQGERDATRLSAFALASFASFEGGAVFAL